MINNEEVRKLLHYNQETGVWTWRERTVDDFQSGKYSKSRRCKIFNTRFANNPTGSVNLDGYVTIRMNGVLYYSHRLAWVYMTGAEAVLGVDHRDGDKLNNKWSNLRLATNSQNAANSKMHLDNKSGVKGVIKYRKKWVASLQGTYLGVFDTAENAHAAYCKAATDVFGDYARSK